MSVSRVGVKYCGGCREQFDRKAGFEKAKAEFSDGKTEFVPVKEDEEYDALIVICGCPSRCADISRYRANENTVTIDSKEGMNCLSKKFIKAN